MKIKRRINTYLAMLLLPLLMLFLASCGSPSAAENAVSGSQAESLIENIESSSVDMQSENDSLSSDHQSETDDVTTPEDTIEENDDASESVSENASTLSVDEDGTYTSKDEVALYLHTYGRLPSNYISKTKAKKLGWDASEGNLWDVAYGKSIGGGPFSNREGVLPEGDYRECDLNYDGSYRGPERLVYSDDGRIYYTADHYETFEQLY